MTGEADETNLSVFARLLQNIDHVAGLERLLRICHTNDFVDLHQVDVIGLQARHRLFELLRRSRAGAAVDFRHQKRLLAIAVGQRLAHALLAHAVVVIPAVIEEVDAAIERCPDDVNGVLLGDTGQAEMIAADTNDGDFRIRAAELTPPDTIHGRDNRRGCARGSSVKGRRFVARLADRFFHARECRRSCCLFDKAAPFHLVLLCIYCSCQ